MRRTKAPLLCRVDQQILKAIHLLSSDSSNIVIVSSGATTRNLASVFPNENVWLAAENGAYVRPPRALWPEFGIEEADGSEWLCMYENLNLQWVKSVEQVCPLFCMVCCAQAVLFATVRSGLAVQRFLAYGTHVALYSSQHLRHVVIQV